MRLLLLVLLAIILLGCHARVPEQELLGAWKVDSTYTFYNGFDYTEREEGKDWAVLQYNRDGRVREIKFGTFRQHRYEVIGSDSLVFKNAGGEVTTAFKILKLNNRALHLYKKKAPLFAGANQERFEIRYFSRTEPPADAQAFDVNQ